MRWDYGAVFKKIRLEKGLSQKNICGSSLSRTTLSKFENNKLSPSFSTMMFLLNQVDMTVEEFEYICNDFHYSERLEIINDFFKLTSNFNSEQLYKIKERCEKFLSKNDDVYINDLLSLVQSLILLSVDNLEQVDCLPKIFVNKVWEKISKMDEWYYSEIRLLNCCLYYFPIETVLFFLPKLLQNIKKYDHFSSMDTIRMSVLLNISVLLIQHNYKTKAAELALLAIDLAKNEKRIDYLSIAKVRYGIASGDMNAIDSGLQILEACEENELVAFMEEEINTFLHKV